MKNSTYKKCHKMIRSALVLGLSALTVAGPGSVINTFSGNAESVYAAEEFIYSELVSGTDTRFEDGMPEAEYDKFSISTKEDFIEFAENCTLDSWSRNKYFTLDNDINLSGCRDIYVPSFAGVFDGNGHTISGISIRESGSACGLFRYVQSGAKVKNLNVSGSIDAAGSAKNVGMIAGANYGNIDGCKASGRITGEENVGGIAGFNAKEGKVTGCLSTCLVVGTHSGAGIAGSNEGLVQGCANEGDVNTSVSDVSIDLSDLSVEDIAKIGSTASLSAFTDIGGITGVNTGEVRSCVNRGTIGYEHVGYNIGGIAGRSSQGYIDSCSNYGKISGRKDVGGIAGQMEPFLQIEYMVDGISQLNLETNRLFDMIDSAIDDLDSFDAEASRMLRELSGKLKEVNHVSLNLPQVDIQGQISEAKQDAKDKVYDTAERFTDGELENPLDIAADAKADVQETKDRITGEVQTRIDDTRTQIENTENTMNVLQENFTAIAEYAGKLSSLLGRGNDTLSSDLKEISKQARKVRNIANGMTNNISAYEGVTITDASDDDSDETSDVISDEASDEISNETSGEGRDVLSGNYGRLIASENYGKVNADSGVGGIVGRISTEYDFDPEDDVSLTGDQSLYMNATAKAIVKNCKNYGEIISKKDYVGGIAGFAKYGKLDGNISVGDVSSESGILAGGIAGESDSEITGCFACGNIEAKSYVGGIAGKGFNVSGCAAYANIIFAEEKAGDIAGDISENGVLSENYYVASKLGGIDGIAYEQGAAPLDYASFTKLPGLPGEFTDFRIIFIADGEELATVSAHYGDSIAPEDIPAVPEKEGCYGVWDESGLGCITRGMVIEPIYEKYTGSVVSSEMTAVGEDEKSTLLVIGDFLPGAELELSENGNEYYFSVSYPENALLARSMGLQSHEGEVTVRLACEDPDNTNVEIFDGTKWEKAQTEKFGSYVSFDMDCPGKFRAEEVKDYTLFIVIAAAGTILIAAIVTGIIVKGIKKMKRKQEMNENPKAVIFDLDGTLIDTERYYRRVWPQAAAHFGFEMSDEQALKLRSLGRPFAPAQLKEWFGEEFNYEVVRTYRKRLFEECVSKEGIKLKPGVKEFLAFLKGKGITIAIATATDIERTTRYLKAAGVYEYFDKICSAADVKEGKPSPYVYEEAVKQLKLKPVECFAVEDAPNGIKSAAAAGCRVIFIPDQTEEEPEAEKLCFAKVQTADRIMELFK